MTLLMAAADRRVRVCLADDHAVLREGLRLLIDSQPDLTVTGEADSGPGAVSLVRTSRPDVLVTDLSMPGGSGLDAIPEVRRATPDTRIVVLSVHEEHAFVRRVLSVGADGYVLKRSAAAELIFAIRRVVAGGVYVDPVIASRLVLTTGARGQAARVGDALTERESEVVTLIARGYGNSEIAARLGISVKTVETHKTRIMDKMRFHSRADIVRYALAEGLLTPGRD
jgi:DNA-binding NarL/FixJ family response regulator